MINRFKVPAVILATIVLGQAVSSAVSAANPDGMVAAGSTRYAMVGTAAGTSTISTSLVDMAGMSTSITIPGGRTGDVMVQFCAELQTPDFVQVRALIGGAATSPGVVELKIGPIALVENRCANFYKKGVGSGTRNVKIQWVGGGGTQQALARSMIVTVNIH